MNIVEQIFDKIVSITENTLSGYSPLRRVYSPELEDLRSVEKGYGVIHGPADDTEGVTRSYTLSHAFELILTRSFVNRLDDAGIQDTINDLYDQADDLLVQFFLTKLQLPTIVMIVDTPSIARPLILDNQAVLLRVGFNVRYRNQIA